MTNLLRHKYLANKANVCFMADVTIIGPFHLLCIQELYTRLIIGHTLSESPITTKDVIALIQEAVLSRISKDINETNRIFHTDNGSIFVANDLLQFANQNGFYLSKGPPYSHSNQVIESFFSLLKRIIRKELLSQLSSVFSPKQLLTRKKDKTSRLVSHFLKYFGKQELSQIVSKAFDIYNSRPHGAPRMFKETPFGVDEAYATYPFHKESPALIVKNDNSRHALAIAAERAEVIGFRNLNWVEYFQNLDIQTQNTLIANSVANLAKKQQDNSDRTNAAIAFMAQQLYEQNRLLQDKLDHLLEDNAKKEEAQRAVEAKRLKRKLAKKTKLRDAVTLQDFSVILECVNELYTDSISRARCKVAFGLLFYSSLRVANLLLFTKLKFLTFLEKREVELPIIKRGPSRHLLCLPKLGVDFFKKIQPEVDLVTSLQPDLGGPLFSPRDNSNKVLNTEEFRKVLNRVMAHASHKLGKNLKTHSFRISFVTGLLENGVPIEKVKELVPHKHISTTALYNRSLVTKKEARAVAEALAKARANGFKIN